MATNKPFANLDKLSKLATPAIPPFNPKINQGAEQANTKFRTEISLVDRTKQVKLGTTNHLAQFFLSDKNTNRDANTKFSDQLSLANRVAQPAYGTTNHLAQYFLSDTFGGKIRIKPLSDKSVIEAKALANVVTITKPSPSKIQGGESPRFVTSVPQQGGTEPVFIKTAIEAKQGIISKEGNLSSAITIVSPTSSETKSAEQGISSKGGNLTSSTQVQEPVQELPQGGTEITTKPQTKKPQGGTKPKLPIDANGILTKQGITQGKGGLKSSTVVKDANLKVDQGFIGNNSYITIAAPTAQVEQGYSGNNSSIAISNPLPVGSLPQGTSGALSSPSNEDSHIRPQKVFIDTLSYRGSRLLFEVAPEVVQGGQLPLNQAPGSGQGHLISDGRSARMSAFLNPTKTQVTLDQAQINAAGLAGGSLDRYSNVGDASNTIMYANVEPYASQEQKRYAIDLLNESDAIEAADLIKLVTPDSKFAELTRQKNLSKNSSVKDLVDSDGQTNKNVTIANTLGSSEGGSDVVESALVGLLTTKLSSQRIQDFKKGYQGKTEDTKKYADGHVYSFYPDITSYEQIVQAYNNSRSNPHSSQKRPESVISISPYKGEGNVAFTAFIKNLSDGLNINYTDFKHVGQQDTFKTFTGATRQLSLGFTVVAMPDNKDFFYSDNGATYTLNKLNKLMTYCGVGTPTNNMYIKGPIINITIVGLVKDLICACTSVKVDVPIGDTSWDIDSELPQQYDVSLDLAVLAMEGGKLLNRSGKFYNF